MTLPKLELRCPFCQTVLAPHVTVCHRCKASKHTRRGMSPLGFRLFAATWLALALPLTAGACWVALVPWTPTGSPPAYALRLIGAKASPEELVRCRVEVVEADGRTAVRLLEGACGDAPAAAPVSAQAGPTPPSLTQRRLAAALHSLLTLMVGLGVSAGLLPLLRPVFQRRAEPSWVRRATA